MFRLAVRVWLREVGGFGFVVVGVVVLLAFRPDDAGHGRACFLGMRGADECVTGYSMPATPQRWASRLLVGELHDFY
ncbi:hypothetical protein [Mycobacterium basiliense]|uniref:hypothetical protein n=1 Tax=Mycobacterium basiliense TaxID=2094119 RepID=UPI0013015E3C|nr:hypothetical protein [Mycobacterium basiliense]